MPAPAVGAAVKVAATSKTGRRMIAAVLVLPLAMVVGVAILAGVLVTVVFSSGSAAAAGACIPQVGLVEKVREEVPKWDAEQLVNAAAIMQAASQVGLTRAAQVLGVQTALQESTLRVLDYGDQVGPDSRGLFQQRDNWGPLDVRMDPLGSSLLFFEALKKVEGWEAMRPEEAIHAVQINERASDYIQRREDAEAIVDAWARASCTGNVPASAQEAAAQLVQMEAQGMVRPQSSDMWQQVVDTANGVSTPNCQVDTRVLQLIILAGQWYAEVGFSDLGRLCVNDCSYGYGTKSMHCKSPALAVDFTSLGGQGLSGWDVKSVDFVQRLASVLPEGSGIGQWDCRANHGVSVETPGIRQFADSCNHFHVELPLADSPLNLQPAS